MLELKQAVDADTVPGRFLITGSADVLQSRRIIDALLGRIDRIELWPLSRSEIQGGKLNFIDELLAGRAPRISRAPIGPDAYAPAIAEGDYPEARLRPAGRLRTRWFRDYLAGTLGRDLRELADLRRADETERLLRLIASQSANLLSYRKIAQQLDLDDNHREQRRRDRRQRSQGIRHHRPPRPSLARTPPRRTPVLLQGRHRHPLRTTDDPPRRPPLGDAVQRTLGVTGNPQPPHRCIRVASRGRRAPMIAIKRGSGAADRHDDLIVR